MGAQSGSGPGLGCPEWRTKAKVRPSGENAGSVSQVFHNPFGALGGEVSLRFSPFSVETRKSPASDAVSATMNLPSGAQVKPRPERLRRPVDYRRGRRSSDWE